MQIEKHNVKQLVCPHQNTKEMEKNFKVQELFQIKEDQKDMTNKCNM